MSMCRWVTVSPAATTMSPAWICRVIGSMADAAALRSVVVRCSS
jgi:hypothetical protein